MSDIRYDLLSDNYVIIAPERLHRPDYMAWEEEDVHMIECPFCEGSEHKTPSELFAIRDDGDANSMGWKSRVVPNLYRAVQIEASKKTKSDGIYSNWEGFGAHEVVIDTPRHLSHMSEFSVNEFYTWLRTIAQRIVDLHGDGRISYISVFKNDGVAAGATQQHPHTQIIGLPAIPKNVIRRLERNYEHYKKTGRAILDDIVTQELASKERIVTQHGSFVAFCPYASAYPFEVMIASSKKTFCKLNQIEDDDMHSLAALLHDLFQRMRTQLGKFDFNLSFSMPPMQKSFDTSDFHEQIDAICGFNIRIMPRIYRHGGFELSTDTLINPVEPERSAKLLREAGES